MDYNNSKIYKLECEDGCYYYGSTTQSLEKRIYNHKKASTKQPYRVYKHINMIGWDKVTIILIEIYPCKSKRDLNKRESEFIYRDRTDKKCLNTILSYATEQQKNEKKKAYLESYKRPLTDKRIEYNRNYNKEYREVKGDELKQKKSEYYYSNKEKLDAKNSENYYKNKEEILRKKREKYNLNKTTTL